MIKPPYKLTSKILSLSTQISEEIIDLEFMEKEVFTPKLRKENRAKAITRTLAIEGNCFRGEESY